MRLLAIVARWQSYSEDDPVANAGYFRLRITLSQGQAQPDPTLAPTAPLDVNDDAISDRMLLAIEGAPLLGAEQGMARLAAILERLAATQLDGHVVSAHMRMAQLALHRDPALARTHALAALALAESRDVSSAYRGELYLHGARALQAAGDESRAQEVLEAGRAWVLAAAQQVPVEFRDGFLHRHPVNRDLSGPIRR